MPGGVFSSRAVLVPSSPLYSNKGNKVAAASRGTRVGSRRCCVRAAADGGKKRKAMWEQGASK